MNFDEVEKLDLSEFSELYDDSGTVEKISLCVGEPPGRGYCGCWWYRHDGSLNCAFMENTTPMDCNDGGCQYLIQKNFPGDNRDPSDWWEMWDDKTFWDNNCNNTCGSSGSKPTSPPTPTSVPSSGR